MKQGTPMRSKRSGIMGMLAALAMMHSGASSVGFGRNIPAAPYTPEKVKEFKYGKKKPIGRNQRKRRKAIRNNPHLLRGKYKKYSR